MKTPSITLALVASLTAALVVAGKAMPPTPALPVEAAAPVVPAQAGSDTYRADDRTRHRPRHERQQRRAATADCHRDVRTHRINGVMVTHRHVGENCAVRVVNRSTLPLPGQ